MSFSFKPDGSLDVAPKKKRDHLPLLLSLEEIPFGMGKKLLIQHLRGERNARTVKLRLDRYVTHGDLGGYEENELLRLITHLEVIGLITIRKEQGKYPVFTLTKKGQEELEKPQLAMDLNTLDEQEAEALALDNPFTSTTAITDKDRGLFKALEDFFPGFNDEQKKAVTSPDHHLMCVAGAGSGKTSVLTKRIAFLIRYRSVAPEKILAITFTRKARKEMEERLAKLLPNTNIRIETFNSFSEKTLQTKGHLLYKEKVTMASFKEQFQLLIDILKDHGYTQASIIDHYFTKRQQHTKDAKTLFFSFAYDFHSLLDKIRLTNATTKQLKKEIKSNQEHAPLAHALLDMADDYLKRQKERHKRDYTDQLLDTIELFKKQPEIIPHFEHVLVDEYQDVNDQQVLLLELLNSKNLFCVGDPRQSIYGWRGSKLGHLLDFPKTYPDAAIIQLTKNYRSTKSILDLCNHVIKKTGYPDLEPATETKGVVEIKRYPSEDEQASAITAMIQDYDGDKKDIFVLARTNKALEKFQRSFAAHNINYLLRTDELKRVSTDPKQGQVTLATVHAIKGLEAKQVYVVGANNTSFPCKASDHPVMDLFHLQEDYDSYAEELRVLYVALSRAQETLHVSYTSSITPFLEQHVPKRPSAQKKLATNQGAALMKLRQWRYQQAKERGVPAYVICPDKTLEALIAQQPLHLEDLAAIPGLGNHRIDEFGEALLEQVSLL